MRNLLPALLPALALAGIAAPAMAAPIFGKPSACNAGSKNPAVLVETHGFRNREGNLRIVIYRANEEEFLASGRYVERIDTPLTAKGSMTVCAPLPANGDYIVVALHDRNADGKLNVWSDGFGFSNNPRLGRSKPEIDKVRVTVNGVLPQSVVLNYVQGLSARPWRERHNP